MAKIKRIVEQSLDDDKAEQIVSIPLAGKSSFADYMVLATGRSQRHVHALADHLAEKLRAQGLDIIGIEGLEACDWVLVDAGDIVIHLFRPGVREAYNLEKMWAAPMPQLEVAG